MRSLLVLAGVAGFGATSAWAAPRTLQGQVISAQGRWNSDHSRIVTDAVVRTADGDVTVVQDGGTVDGLAMRTFPGAATLAPGMGVTLTAHDAMDLSQRPHVVVDTVKVDGLAPDFVRTGPTDSGHYLYWESGCIFLTIDSAGTSEVPHDQELAVIDASIATWNDDTASCSYMKVMSQGEKPVAVNAQDHVNVLVFRDTTWCEPATASDPPLCHPDSAAGITTVTYVNDKNSSRDGAIVDADIEINGVDSDFAISVNGKTSGQASCHAELQNTLTHELGHLHGLQHTCTSPNDPPPTSPPWVDDQGNPVPACTATTDPKILDATMYPYQDCGETKKETLEADDVNAICTIYPTKNDPGTCAPVGKGGGCCSAGGGPGGPAVLGLVVVAIFRRRRRSGTI